MDEDEVAALSTAVNDRAREQSWTNLHEVTAAAVEALWAVLARLDGGVATVAVQETRQAHDYGTYPRPEWLKPVEPQELVVHHVGDVVRLMRGGG